MFKKKRPKNGVDVPEAGGVLAIEAHNTTTGEAVDPAVLEEADIAFDPTKMHLDLTKKEKRRTTALMLAIQAYDHLIIKDADYLREAHSQARHDGSTIRPATMNAMVNAAIQFDAFISGGIFVPTEDIARAVGSVVPEPSPEKPQSDDAVARSDRDSTE